MPSFTWGKAKYIFTVISPVRVCCNFLNDVKLETPIGMACDKIRQFCVALGQINRKGKSYTVELLPIFSQGYYVISYSMIVIGYECFPFG